VGSDSGNSLHSLFLGSDGGADESNCGLQTDLELHEHHLETADALTDLNIHGSVQHLATKAPPYDFRTEEKQQEIADTDCESLCQDICHSREPSLLSLSGFSGSAPPFTLNEPAGVYANHDATTFTSDNLNHNSIELHNGGSSGPESYDVNLLGGSNDLHQEDTADTLPEDAVAISLSISLAKQLQSSRLISYSLRFLPHSRCQYTCKCRRYSCRPDHLHAHICCSGY
jgi:hypothetical protein